ncbi:unnamed protein product [Symbiodinium sp. CCMP2456]|nr:unnamed protein product [Symbiodinium sp. CCMP2456]
MVAQPLHELFDNEKLIKKRFKVKGYFVDFPPSRASGDEDGGDKKENPISTKAMEMNVTALKVMFSYYKVTSGKKVPIQKLESAQGVRELFSIIESLRDAEEDAEDSADGDAEGEEEEGGEDDPVSEESEDPSSEARVSDKSVGDKDDGGGVKAALADLELDPDEETQAPKWRYRSKSTLNSLATTAVLGDQLETPGSYEKPVTASKEEELQQLLQQISLFEDGEPKHPDTARHDALLLMMGSPARPRKSRGTDETPPTCKKQLFKDVDPAWKEPPDQADTLVTADAPIEPTHKKGGVAGDQGELALVEAPIDVDSSPEKIKPEPQSPKATSGDDLVKPVSLEQQNALRTDLRAKLRRVRGGKTGPKKKQGKVSAAKGGKDAAQVAKRKRGTCDSEPAASSLPKAKAKAKGKAKAAPSGEAVPKAKAKAVAKGKAKAKSSPKRAVDSGVALRLKPDPSRTGHSKCGTLLLGCSTCRWGPLGCGTCLRTNFHGVRWNAVACGEWEE